MATVKGPLMSMDARGTVGGAIVFGGWKGQQWVRRHAIPNNPNTPGQVAQREIFAMAVAGWKVLTDPNKASWEVGATASGQKVSGFNYFTSAYISSMREGTTPETEYA